MKAQIARKIYDRLIYSLELGNEITPEKFGHVGKRGAINEIWFERDDWFSLYNGAKDKLEFLERLPWIGPITKYHLAKNFGLDYCKPDRWLVRIATSYETTPEELCGRLAKETGDRIGTVDYVIWRAANLGLVKFGPPGCEECDDSFEFVSGLLFDCAWCPAILCETCSYDHHIAHQVAARGEGEVELV